MEFQVDSGSVVKATDAKVFLEHKLSYLQLRLMKMQSALKATASKDPSISRMIAVFQESMVKQEQIFNSLKKELAHNLKDYSGYEQPPVLTFNTLFKDLDAAYVRPYEEGQYVLGSLSDEDVNEITQMCSHMYQAQLATKKLEKDIQTLLPAKETNTLFSEMLRFPEFSFPSAQEVVGSGQETAGFQKIEKFMEEWILRLQETEERVQAKQDKLFQKEKQFLKKEAVLDIQEKQQQQKNKELGEKERALLEQEQRLIEQQAAHEEKSKQLTLLQTELERQQKALYKQQQQVDQELKQLQHQETQLKIRTQLLDQRETLLAQQEKQAILRAQETNLQNNSTVIADQQALLQQQKEILHQIEQERERLDAEKKWVKGLLSKLLEQHDVIEQVQEKIRHAEHDSLQRQEDILRQEKGWLKVEKSKLNKTQSDPIDVTSNNFEDIF